MFSTQQPQYGNNYGGYQQYNGVNPQQVQKFSNSLTAEEIDRLKKKGSNFSLFPTEEEALRGVCNHRTADGTSDALVTDPATGEVYCTICGYRFRMVEPNLSAEDIKGTVDDLVDILQTIKFMYVDLPAEASRKYFQIIPLLEKVPQLFEYAAKNFNNHNLFNWSYQNQGMGAWNMFNDLQARLGNGVYQSGYGYQQPQQNFQGAMNQPAGYPGAAYGQPQGAANPAYGQPNPFGYAGASQAGYQPQNTGFAYQPNQAVPNTAVPATTPAPAATDANAKTAEATTTVTQQVNA